MFNENLPLAGWFAGLYVKLANSWCFDFDDLKQEASLGLWFACLTFDPSRAVKFSVHARQEMRAQVQEFFRRNGIVKGAGGGKIQVAPMGLDDTVESVEYQGKGSRTYVRRFEHVDYVRSDITMGR